MTIRPLKEAVLSIGEKIHNGAFQVENALTTGAFAVIYGGTRLADGLPVAIKTLNKNAEDLDPMAVKRFEQEAAVIAHLDHPNIVKLLAFGQTPSGAMYLVLERLNGDTLHQIIYQGRTEDRVVMRIMRQLLEAVEYAHRELIVHRDLKPANIIVTKPWRRGEEAEVKILDFGFAKILGDMDWKAGVPLTLANQAVGTPGYVAPETLTTGEVTPAADLYAVGVVAFELLTGDRAFKGSGVELAIAQVEGRRLPVSVEISDNPLFPLIDKLMAPTPDGRFANATEALAALEAVSHPPRKRRKWLGL